MKRTLRAYLLALVSGTHMALPRQADAEHLRRAARHGHAGTPPGGPRRGSGLPLARNSRSTMTRPSRIGSSGWIQAVRSLRAGLGVPVEPVMVGRQVELAGPAGNRGAAADVHQPLVFAQVLRRSCPPSPAGTRRPARSRTGRRRGLLRRSPGCCETRATIWRWRSSSWTRSTLRSARLATSRISNRVTGRRGARGRPPPDEMGHLFEQILQAEKSADPLVERIFVGDHARAWLRISGVGQKTPADRRGIISQPPLPASCR